jgi:uncharacterized protein YbcI
MEMGGPIQDGEVAKEEIAREIVKVHQESYGTSARKVQVALHDDFIAVVLDLDLTQAERTLIERGNSDSVKATREAFQEAIEPTFTAIVERAVGRRVIGFASRTIVGTGGSWSIEAFRLADHSSLADDSSL